MPPLQAPVPQLSCAFVWACSYDYESVETDKADAVMARLGDQINAFHISKAANPSHSALRVQSLLLFSRLDLLSPLHVPGVLQRRSWTRTRWLPLTRSRTWTLWTAACLRTKACASCSLTAPASSSACLAPCVTAPVLLTCPACLLVADCVPCHLY